MRFTDCTIVLCVVGCPMPAGDDVERCVDGTLSPSGGAIELDGATLSVEPGVLSAAVDLTLCASLSEHPFVVGTLYTVGPPGLSFHEPLSIDVAHPAPENQDLFVAGRDGPRPDLFATRDSTSVRGRLYRTGETWLAAGPSIVVPFGTAANELDVLFVVDNSCSTHIEQHTLADAFPSFRSSLLAKNVDFRAGVTSTDMDGVFGPNGSEGALRATASGVTTVDPTTPNAAAVFRELVAMGTSGSGSERGISAAYAALVDRAAENRFVRPEGNLAVYIVTDEPGQTRVNEATPQEFVDWMAQEKAAPLQARMYAMINATGKVYAQTAEATGGQARWASEQHPTTSDQEGLLSQIVHDLPDKGSMRLDPPAAAQHIEAWWVPHEDDMTLLDTTSVHYDPDTAVIAIDAPEVPPHQIMVRYRALTL